MLCAGPGRRATRIGPAGCGAARAQSALFKAFGRTPPIEPAAADQARYFWYFDGAKARQELGFAPREASATIFDTITYVREHHLGNGAFKKKS